MWNYSSQCFTLPQDQDNRLSLSMRRNTVAFLRWYYKNIIFTFSFHSSLSFDSFTLLWCDAALCICVYMSLFLQLFFSPVWMCMKEKNKQEKERTEIITWSEYKAYLLCFQQYNNNHLVGWIMKRSKRKKR